MDPEELPDEEVRRSSSRVECLVRRDDVRVRQVLEQ